jgi:hypothetical protein
MSNPLARNLLREFTNWRPRYTKEAKLQKCKKCKHSYLDQWCVTSSGTSCCVCGSSTSEDTKVINTFAVGLEETPDK